MSESNKKHRGDDVVFKKIVECPKCGGSLKVTNTPEWIITQCSEDFFHYLVSKPAPMAHRQSRHRES